MQTQTATQTPVAVVNAQTALQQQQAKLQAQIAALQAQATQIAQLGQNVQQGEFFVVKPSNAQTNVGVQDLPKAVTLILQLLPLVTGSNNLLPQQQHSIAQLLLQAASQIEQNGNVPLAKQRIAQA